MTSESREAIALADASGYIHRDRELIAWPFLKAHSKQSPTAHNGRALFVASPYLTRSAATASFRRHVTGA